MKGIFFLASALSISAAAAGEAISNFRLLTDQDEAVELYRQTSKRFVVLISYSNGCPILREYFPLLKRLRSEFAESADFFLIAPDPSPNISSIQAERRAFSLEIPMLMDLSQTVSSELGIQRSAEALVLATGTWKKIYHGPIDDRIGYHGQKPKAETEHLKAVLTALIRNEVPRVASRSVEGCKVTYDSRGGFSPAQPEYSKISSILSNKCQRCHSPDGIGPFEMNGYESVRKWSAMIGEVVRMKRMPPFQISPFHEEFKGDASLSPFEEANILNWIRGEMKRGKGQDHLAKAAPKRTSPKASYTIDLPEQKLPAEGPIEYRYLYVEAPNAKEEWVNLRIRTLNPKILHHASVFLVSADEPLEISKARFDRYLATFAPGADYDMLGKEFARRLPAKAKLLIVLHYQASGKPEADKPFIDVYRTGKTPHLREMVNQGIKNTEFTLKPEQSGQKITAHWESSEPLEIHAAILHMHSRGTKIELRALPPSGKEKVLVSVPHYDAKWQNVFAFKKPVKFPKGTRFICNGVYDNSSANPANPDSSKTVRFGLYAEDEMLMCHLEIAGRTLN